MTFPPDRALIDPAERLSGVLEVIGRARTRLALAAVRVSDPAVLAALIAAINRGVQVDTLFPAPTGGATSPWGDTENVLCEVGARLTAYPAEIRYHAKYIVADDGPCLVGSFNFGRRDFKRSADFGVITEDETVADGLWRLFEADCAGAPQFQPPGGRLSAGPGALRGRYVELLAAAQHSIRVVGHKFTDAAMRDLLVALQGEGIQVSVHGRRSLRPLRAHGRMVLIDDQRAVVGSAALSTRSLDERRELCLLVTDPEAVSRFSTFAASLPGTSLEPGGEKKDAA